ncbi:tripartite motif-containing 13 isoform X3 [Genypterus blacodes]|uniref:tripartite motif-containing 13 isoform X3 n=1 Tax=Genypterus blacodes TaxID=154954 RepID=UPI003F7643C0
MKAKHSVLRFKAPPKRLNLYPEKGEVCTATSAMIALQSASQQLGSMELLEEDLTCPICCCIFDDPRVLLCSHSFCKKCLEGILEGNRGPVYRTPFKCPTCRKETPHNGAHSLQINYSLRGIVEKYSKIRVLPRMSFCKQHCGQPLNIFCATDLKLICGFCATTDAHRGHTFSSLEDAYKGEKKAFEDMFQGMERCRQSGEILTCLETLQASKKKALQSVSKDAEEVKDYFDKLISALECKKNEILSDFETMRLVVMQAHDPQITKLNAALEEQGQALNIAESFRSVSDPLGFLQQMQEFREKQRILRETPLPSRKVVDAGAFACNFDVKKWDSLRLREVDKISLTPEPAGSNQAGRLRSAGLALFYCLVFVMIAITMFTPEMADQVPPQIETYCKDIKSRLLHIGQYLQERVCTDLIGADEECIADFFLATDERIKGYLS